MGGDIRDRAEEIFVEISKNHDFERDTLEIARAHVHIPLSFPHGYIISKVAGMLKGISARVIFHEHPEANKALL